MQVDVLSAVAADLELGLLLLNDTGQWKLQAAGTNHQASKSCWLARCMDRCAGWSSARDRLYLLDSCLRPLRPGHCAPAEALRLQILELLHQQGAVGSRFARVWLRMIKVRVPDQSGHA
jgi:hypothetical protein